MRIPLLFILLGALVPMADARSLRRDLPTQEPELIALALEELENGNLPGAEALIQKRLASDPNDAEARELWEELAFVREPTETTTPESDALRARLDELRIPRVSFDALPLSQVVELLASLTEGDEPASGINIVLIDPTGADPAVTLTLRNLSLAEVLDFTLESVGFEYELRGEVVIVRPGSGSGTRLETDFFALTRSTLIRLTGPAMPRPVDATANESAIDQERALKDFFTRAGVPFDTVEGGALALADGQLIVTNTARNLAKVRDILRRYTAVKQVEIEARFLEVNQSDLEELGFNWMITSEGEPVLDTTTGQPLLNDDGSVARTGQQTYRSGNRSLEQAFGIDPGVSEINITGLPENVGDGGTITQRVPAPDIPQILDVATGALNLANLTGVIGEFDVDLIIRALSRRSGTDLMSAPKVTVLSGKTAEIVVAQELRYPQSFSDIDARVGIGDSDSGSAGVAITAGTPRDFTTRNVGVEMEVTPTVEDDNAISLLLAPRVTEFEGFVEYGGPSVAIASDTTVTVPSGFYQPIFSVRQVRTEVTIWDGATVILGGLTREQAVQVEDKVPLLGDIPLLGRLFRSEGESSQKRNLLIFVTASLVSPGGGPARQSVGDIPPGSTYQQPTYVTPEGAEERR